MPALGLQWGRQPRRGHVWLLNDWFTRTISACPGQGIFSFLSVAARWSAELRNLSLESKFVLA